MPFTVKWVRHCADKESEHILTTPAGKLLVVRCGDVICKLDWLEFDSGEPVELSVASDALLNSVLGYWREPNKTVTLKLLEQGTSYRQKVWREMLNIPFGATVTYKSLATVVGSGPRAVGGACRANPYPLIVPCHRVVSVSGIGGYSGDVEGEWLSIKLRLLEYERRFVKHSVPIDSGINSKDTYAIFKQ
ncbi:MAG: methylated-DNA--[protein]-cysteine S-methyltransferase [Gammaproteobacteria bacterium]